ncbi:MAG: hypothetical protein WD767_18180 [Alphaproteobacteria bacterium]
MTIAGQAILLALLDIDPAVEDEFNEWYNREHMRDRVIGLPGFRRGRRFESAGGNPRYAALYEAESAESFTSEAYLSLIRDPDENSRRYLPNFIGPTRFMGRLLASAGEGEGAVAGFYLFDAVEGRTDALRQWLADTVPGFTAERGVIAAHAWEVAADLVAASKRVHLRQTPDRVPGFVVLVEAARAPGIASVDRLLMGPEGIAAHGGTAPSIAGNYRTVYRVGP